MPIGLSFKNHDRFGGGFPPLTEQISVTFCPAFTFETPPTTSIFGLSDESVKKD